MWKYWNVPKVDWGTYRDIRDTTEEIVDIMNARDEPEGIYWWFTNVSADKI